MVFLYLFPCSEEKVILSKLVAGREKSENLSPGMTGWTVAENLHPAEDSPGQADT